MNFFTNVDDGNVSDTATEVGALISSHATGTAGVRQKAKWCVSSVSAMLRLRYIGMADRFDGVKNNQMKKDAYDLLAAELSIGMERVFDARSVQSKIHDLKQQWFKPQVKATGNGLLVRSKPQYYDIMFEYWGSIPVLSRDTLMSSDVPALDGNDIAHDSDASSSALESECEPTVRGKQKSARADSLFMGLEAVAFTFNDESP
ncbi:hypothetical protein H310_03145 [Aphanomyces invadans]|uniref:Myb/SANT-like domain-containing protein n=1 Tax=Aphanomyces invadans TaxID=157072 RepID=A0A024UN78_9STRA|nr:hypothetical protein H310_03145 [Aphanomyces invadans]ETW07073.1 hypothetical protein H310_03145 [Aphanomyces invadans]|eukprot:XP_008865148.1 hypothetical protein H310_03145 [Aphanomyces invadans]